MHPFDAVCTCRNVSISMVYTYIRILLFKTVLIRHSLCLQPFCCEGTAL